jgi:hypothetical protein
MNKKEKHDWTETHFKLSNGVLLKIYHNLPNQIQAAFDNWLVRTKRYTEKSFCDYINDKRKRGLSDHIAYTEEEYLDLKIEDLKEK